MVELLSDPFLITQNGAYLWINSLIFYIDVARRYVIGNPASSSAHVCEDKHFTSLRGNEHRMLRKFENITEHIQLIKLSKQYLVDTTILLTNIFKKLKKS